MRSFFQICLVTSVQTVACVIAGWGMVEALFIGSFVLIWQTLFILLMLKIRARKKTDESIKYPSLFWMLIFPASAVFSPMIAIAVFIGGTLWDLIRVSGESKLSGCIGGVKDENTTPICRDSESPSFDRINYNSENNYPMGWKF